MVILLILPNVAGAIVTVPVPVGLNVTVALAGLNVVVFEEVKVVNAPVLAVLAPILILLMLPNVAGAIVTLPVPVGLIETEALFGLIVVVEVELNPANVLDNPVLTAPVTPIPPVTINVPDEVFVLAVPAVNVVAALLVRVVKAPLALCTVPIGVFCMLPAYNLSPMPTPPTMVNAPVVVLVDPVAKGMLILVLVQVVTSVPLTVAVILPLTVGIVTFVVPKLILFGVAHSMPVPVDTNACPAVPVAPPAVNVPVMVVLVNLPVDAVVAPILILLFVPNAAGFKVTVPVPGGLTVIDAFAG
jgi:hypothetical protein